MNDAQLDALVTAAREGGVACDGLRVSHVPDGEASEDDGEAGFTVETPGATRQGLDEGELREAAAENPWFVSNWYYWERVDRPEHERAFLRWLEDADDRTVPGRYEALAAGDLAATWGQLHVSIGLGDDGRRTYTLRHEADADRDPEGLDVRADPLDAREIAKFDEKGRYRPLKTAPTLRRGWAFVDLDGRTLTHAIDLLYPATIANWHLERRGELDVSHWRETMERQSGIYGVVETWDRGEGHEHVEWVAEACCDDSQCLKRREWEYDDATDLEAAGGDGAFPCREPCSLVVAGAREWTKLEAEESRTYEFELTPSEKEQLEEIVDAVADGSVDDVREADFGEGANRYRARFLRAKRFDDEGRLGGVPTDPDEE